MGLSLVKGGQPQSLPGRFSYDSIDVDVNSVIAAFGPGLNIGNVTLIILHTQLNATIQGITGGGPGAQIIFMLGTSAAAGTVTFAHNSGAAAVGDKIYNSIGLVDFVFSGNGYLEYLWGPIRNLGNFWQSPGAA